MNHIVDVHVAYIKTISDLNQDKAELLERIKRLEEAGDAMHKYIAVTRGLLPECTNNWRKAKEAKP